MQPALSTDHASFEALMRQYNSRLFRTARAILKDDAEAEDALQESWIEAYKHLGDFRGDAELPTWLTRIVVNRSLMRLRAGRKHRNVIPIDGRDMPGTERTEVDVEDVHADMPADLTWRAEVRRLLERRIDELPLDFRTVFVMREVQDMTVHETAEALEIPEATVRSRLFRARALLRASVARDIDVAAADAFSFLGERCDRIVANVLSRI